LPGEGRAGAKEGSSAFNSDTIPPEQAQLALQSDVCKEMVNKIAWVLGSTYRRSYSNMKTPARLYAWRIVKQVIKDHGYPDKISK